MSSRNKAIVILLIIPLILSLIYNYINLNEETPKETTVNENNVLLVSTVPDEAGEIYFKDQDNSEDNFISLGIETNARWELKKWQGKMLRN